MHGISRLLSPFSVRCLRLPCFVVNGSITHCRPAILSRKWGKGSCGLPTELKNQCTVPLQGSVRTVLPNKSEFRNSLETGPASRRREARVRGCKATPRSMRLELAALDASVDLTCGAADGYGVTTPNVKNRTLVRRETGRESRVQVPDSLAAALCISGPITSSPPLLTCPSRRSTCHGPPWMMHGPARTA
jgi:hypothetical protein